MTCSMTRRAWLDLCSQTVHRQVFSPIRVPVVVHQQLRIQPLAQNRSLHITGTKCNKGFSVTFGPQIDHVLKSRKQKRKKSTVKDIGKNDASTTQSLKPISVDSDLTASQSENLRIEDGPAPSANAAIELSEDAYDTISTPRQTNASNSSEDQAVTKTLKRRQTGEKSWGRNIVATKPRTRATSDTAEARQQNHKVQNDRELRSKKGVSASLRKPLPTPQPKHERWRIQKDALEKKFEGETWSPRKKLSPDAVEGIRTLHEQDPERYSTPILSEQFKVSPEAIRRILRSKWRPSADKMDERRARWARRYDRIWDQQAALGLRPPRTRDREPEGPEAFDEEVYAKQMLRQL